MRLNIDKLQSLKKDSKKIVCATSYDASFAKILDDIVDVQLVGDSLGMVCQGWENTLRVTVDNIIYHCQAVVRSSSRSLVMADAPFLSCTTIENGIVTAGKIVQKGGAQIIKLEQSPLQFSLVKALNDQGIAVCSHLGLRPQYILTSGVYRYAGMSTADATLLLEQAERMEEAGSALLLLECVPSDLAAKISKIVSIPVIGIGSGSGCDGQILVSYDIIGVSPKTPKFAKNYLNGAHDVKEAFSQFASEVRLGVFPDSKHTLH